MIAEHPDYADPYLMLARPHDATDMTDLAVSSYQQFLDRAPRSDAQRAYARDRVQTLGGVATKSPADR